VLVVAFGLSLAASLSGCYSEEGGATPAAQQGATAANVSLGTTSEVAPEVAPEAPEVAAPESQVPTEPAVTPEPQGAGQSKSPGPTLTETAGALSVTSATGQSTQRPQPARQGQQAKPADPATFAIKLDPTQLDLGRIATGDSNQGTVKLVNTGTDPMKVVNARTSCGCTTANVPRGKTLEPGESADVSINLQGKGRDGLTMNKTVTFIFEDPDLQQWTLTLPVRGEVFAYVKLEPFVLDSEEGDVGRVTLTSTDDQPFRVMNMHPEVLENLPTEAKLEHVVEFSWDKWRETGSSRKLAFYLDHPKVPSLMGTVKMTFQPPSTRQVKEPVARPGPTPAAQLDFDIGRGNIAGIMEEITSGEMKVDAPDLQGRTVLMLAARYGNQELLAFCLEAGANVNAKDRALMTALMWAGHSKNAAVTNALIEAGSDLEAVDKIGGTALCWAAGFGDGASVEALLEAGANPDVSSTLVGFTPLIWAAGYNADAGAVEALIQAGVPLEAVDTDNTTALMHAARTGRAANVRALVNAGADAEVTNSQGKTALLLAAMAPQARVDTLQVLVEAGASLEATDWQGLSALDLARQRTDANAADVISYFESVMGVADSANKND
jgi:ankyrin repeat protein